MTLPTRMTRGFEAYLAEVRANPDVVGLVLTGSRGRGAFVRATSDWDVRLVVRDESYAEVAETLATGHGSPIEVVVYSLAAFERVGEPRTETAWDRYSYVHASVLVDKLDGRIGQIVAGKAVLSEGIGPGLAAFELDGYVNAYYRALKNDRAGLVAEAHLDAAESIPPLLTTVFAVHDRSGRSTGSSFGSWSDSRCPSRGSPTTGSFPASRRSCERARSAIRRRCFAMWRRSPGATTSARRSTAGSRTSPGCGLERRARSQA